MKNASMTAKENTTLTPASGPGKINHGEIVITLHTTHGFSMYRGRKGKTTQHGIIGFRQFNTALNKINDTEHLDRIEDVLIDVQERIQQIKEQLNKAFDRNHLQTATKPASTQPVELHTTLRKRLARRGAQLLVEYDLAVMQSLGLYGLGVFSRHEHHSITNALSRNIRKAYASPIYTLPEVVSAADSSEPSDDQQADPTTV